MRQLDDLDKYQRVRQIDAMNAAAGNPGGGAMGDMMGAGMGVVLGQQMANQMNQQPQPSQQTPPPLTQDAQTYHVEVNGAAAGPYNMGQVRQMISGGQLTPQTLVWTAGLAGWMPAGQVPALHAFFAAPPPLPGGAAQVPPVGSSGPQDA